MKLLDAFTVPLTAILMVPEPLPVVVDPIARVAVLKLDKLFTLKTFDHLVPVVFSLIVFPEPLI